ncbi:MAG: HAD family hydrolase [bacterium]|nr:HAD family hydrolase [bacterium]
MIKNIIFDWSGVIKDALLSHVWAVNKMFEIMGGNEMSLKEIKENWEQPYMNFWNKYYPKLTLEEEQKLYYEVVLRKDCPESDAYSGIIKLIKKLKQKGVPMVILSSDSPETLFPEMKRFGLENIFSEVMVKIHDKGEVIHELMERNSFEPEETVFIGDSNHEIEAGKQVGVKTIAVTWGFCTEEKLKLMNPDFLVHNIKELGEILL